MSEADDFIDANIKLVSAMHEKSKAYTNLIMIAGYASFFGIWSLTKDHLSAKEELWSALLMSISILTFVLFEVFIMYISGRQVLAWSAALRDPQVQGKPDAIMEQMQNYEKRSQRTIVQLSHAWYVNLVIAVFTGLTALGILFYAFIRGIITAYS